MRTTNTLLVAGCLAAASGAAFGAADVREGLVSYWPLDTLDVSTASTPDVVSGNNFLSYHMPEAVVPGRVGNAFEFNPDLLTHLEFTNPEGVDTGLPVSMSPTWTVMFWVKASYPVEGELDRRVYSESSSTVDDPLVNIGTDNDADTDGGDQTVDLFIRNSGTQVNHVHGTRTAYDGQWHHVALVDSGGTLTLYVDGEVDLTLPFSPGPTPRDVTSIGAVVRQGGNSVVAYFRGLVDEVAVWERALTQEEVAGVMNNGIQTPVPKFAPTITSQTQGPISVSESANVTLSAHAIGNRPLSYQWKRNGANIPGATSPSITLTGITAADAGEYTVTVTNPQGSTDSQPIQITVTGFNPEDLKVGLVSHWPLDAIVCNKMPDVVSGYDMDIINLTPADIVSGRVGSAVSFSNERQTLLERVHGPDDELPMNKHEAFTLSFWAQVNYILPSGATQNDLRLFSEGSTGDSDPLFNIGTHSAGADGSIDVFIRRSGWPTIDHIRTTSQPFDGTWHHIAFVQEEDGSRTIFIDGVPDELQIPAKPAGQWNVNNTTIGGILRSSRTHWVTGLIDDVAIWKRALSPLEIEAVIEDGVPEVEGNLQPLAVRTFQSEFPAVRQGGTVQLNWDASPGATLTIEPGLGDVTAQSDCGVGSATVTVNETTTYTLTVTRGDESITAQTTVTVIPGVAAGWNVLDTFDTYTPGPIANTSRWKNPQGLASIVNLNNNKALGFDGGDDLNALELGSRTLKEGQQATVFFRFRRAAEDNTPALTGINVGLSDKPIRFVDDFDDDFGPFIRIERALADLPADILARYGVGGLLDYGNVMIETGKVYNVWIDIQNGPLSDFDTGDLFTVHVAEEGQATRTTVFQDYLADRNPQGSADLGVPKPDLSILVASAIGASQGVQTVLLDDFFISDTGSYNATVPVPAKSFDPAPAEIGELTITQSGNQIVIGWSQGVLESANSIDGDWSPVAGANPPTHSVTPTDSKRFFRARQ
jgi:hypothetical protein